MFSGNAGQVECGDELPENAGQDQRGYYDMVEEKKGGNDVIGCLVTAEGEVFAVSQTGQTRPIPEGPRWRVDPAKAHEFRVWIMDNLSRCRAERDRLAVALKGGSAKYYAVRKTNYRDVRTEIRRWKSMMSDLNALDPAGMLP